ncbi:hypothetical protein NRIC_33950 [Enterococcus florum]|uniref:Uncharacterized protein n=1 Tax=Enterococcus florum TaxID=2480627 RepID=A0A4P5PFH0_9ENTE|nr:hypothetical protein NRIC_33950 [Enterococcus florum]
MILNHHIGSKIWLGNNIPAITEQDLGLDYFSFVVPDQAELDRHEKKVQEVVAYTFAAALLVWLLR